MGISVFPAPSAGLTQKVQEFTSTGTFVVPSNVSSVEVFLVGGGGGAAGGRTSTSASGKLATGGGGGGGVYRRQLTVTPGASITVTIGAGGAGGSNTAAGVKGTASTFGSLLTCLGGGGGTSYNAETNTYYISTVTDLATVAGASVEGYIGVQAGAGGGAGGNAYVPFTTDLTIGSSQTYLMYGFPTNVIGNAVTHGTGAPARTASSPSLVMTAGASYEGYGGGGAGGYILTGGDTAGQDTIPSLGSTPGIMQPGNANGGANGINASANTGHGGGGGARITASTATTITGGNGGSGYCRVVYWS